MKDKNIEVVFDDWNYRIEMDFTINGNKIIVFIKEISRYDSISNNYL